MWSLLVVFICSSSGILAAPQNVGIIGGKTVDIEKVPYQVQMETDLGQSYQCGGVLIAPNWVLSTATCTSGNAKENIQIRVGTSIRQSGGEIIQLKTLVRHPKFDFTNFDYDISLLELAKNVTLSKSVQPVPLIEANKTLPVGTNGTISGWGVTEPGSKILSDDLQMAVVPIVDHLECNHRYALKNSVTERMLCAGYLDIGGVDNCMGDGGGPLVANGKLVGLISWGSICASKGYPGVYTDVSYFRNYIKEITGI